ncbi:hypothetical protein RUM43_000142 [Polyplax serrata]|uniref:Uncharacterized protein n=1 Tax=Polyplax serrata TaxID=468196 RepID=A0AAN8SC02_POLSC
MKIDKMNGLRNQTYRMAKQLEPWGAQQSNEPRGYWYLHKDIQMALIRIIDDRTTERRSHIIFKLTVQMVGPIAKWRPWSVPGRVFMDRGELLLIFGKLAASGAAGNGGCVASGRKNQEATEAH